MTRTTEIRTISEPIDLVFSSIGHIDDFSIAVLRPPTRGLVQKAIEGDRDPVRAFAETERSRSTASGGK